MQTVVKTPMDGDSDYSDYLSTFYHDLIRLAASRLSESAAKQITPASVVHSMAVSLANHPVFVASMHGLPPDRIIKALGKRILRHCNKLNKRVSRHQFSGLEAQYLTAKQMDPSVQIELMEELNKELERLRIEMNAIEQEILLLIIQGVTQGDIAEKLHLPLEVVETIFNGIISRLENLDS